ncbi:MAG TPA: S41 family peptidase [Gemmatimonadales bacterium]|nr:S41 family peptidase [Gemmatimonadales bacterium]
MRPLILAGMGLLLLGVARPVHARQLGPLDRERGVLMLHVIQKDLAQRYYDSTYHGLDLKALFDSAETEIKSAPSNGDIFGIIAGTLLKLSDSHTFFLPPARVSQVDYGWTMRMVGDTAFVFTVKPGSDAQAGGLRVGDAVLGVDRYRPTRRDFTDLIYWFHALSPQDALTLTVRAPEPGAQPRRFVARAKVSPGRAILDLTGHDGGNDIWDLIRRWENVSRSRADQFATEGDVLVWQLKSFDNEDQMDRGIKRAAGYAGLVVDLRNNPGGEEHALQRLIGNLLGQVDTVATIHRRHETVPLVSKPSSRPYTGKLVVVVDAGSASASEILARTMQLRHRGTVLGDTTAGAVMRSVGQQHQIGAEIVVFYAVSVTDAEVVMADGGRLEKVGVVPDVFVLPTGSDLAAGRDPALAMAITLAGHRIDPDSAGRLLPPAPENR